MPEGNSVGSGGGHRTPGIWTTPRDDILSLRGAVAPPCATWSSSPGSDVLRERAGHGFAQRSKASLKPAVFPVAVQGNYRSHAPNAPKDAVLPHWGSSGTWMCRARELRQDADVSDDPQCGRTAAPSGADDHALETDTSPLRSRPTAMLFRQKSHSCGKHRGRRRMPAAEPARQSRHHLACGAVPRKVRAPQGTVPGNAWAARADGKCNRKIPPNGSSECVARVKWCGKSAPRVRQRTGTANPTGSKTK